MTSGTLRHRRSRRPVSRGRAAVVPVAAGLLGLQVWACGPASPAIVTASGTGALTCFAVDVSGSNITSSDDEPPSDPGPVFVRQQVVELFSAVLADLGQATGQRVGVVTFGTGIGTRIGPLAISDPAARSRLETALPRALRPSPAEAAWTDWVAGLIGCEQMFERTGATRGMVVMLTDGFPQGPAGSPAAQLAAIAPIAKRLWAHGVVIQPVLYGAGARQRGTAGQATTQLAILGHGQPMRAATPLDMLHSALSLASLATGLPLGGSEVRVNGSTTVPIYVSPQVAAAVLVVLRSSSQVQIAVGAPGGRTISSADAGTPWLGLVIALTRPAAGSYEASADGQGSVFAAELLRYAAVTLPSPGPSRSPRHARPPAASRSDPAWITVLALAVLAFAGLFGWLIASKRRRPVGNLVVRWGSLTCTLDPADLNGLMRLEQLFQADDPTGWSVGWTRRAPAVLGPDGSVIRLMPDKTMTVPTTPPTTFTWVPDGIDSSLSDEPPGRPASALP